MDDDPAVRLCIMIVDGGSSMRFDIKDQNYICKINIPVASHFLPQVSSTSELHLALDVWMLPSFYIACLCWVPLAGHQPTRSPAGQMIASGVAYMMYGTMWRWSRCCLKKRACHCTLAAHSHPNYQNTEVPGTWITREIWSLCHQGSSWDALRCSDGVRG